MAWNSGGYSLASPLRPTTTGNPGTLVNIIETAANDVQFRRLFTSFTPTVVRNTLNQRVQLEIIDRVNQPLLETIRKRPTNLVHRLLLRDSSNKPMKLAIAVFACDIAQTITTRPDHPATLIAARAVYLLLHRLCCPFKLEKSRKHDFYRAMRDALATTDIEEMVIIMDRYFTIAA